MVSPQLGDAACTLRQRQLPDVGEDGQARLAAEPAAVNDAEPLCARYLEGAGVPVALAPDAPLRAEGFPHGAAFHSPEVRAAAAQLWGALALVRARLASVESR